jgi:hypothetical protein
LDQIQGRLALKAREHAHAILGITVPESLGLLAVYSRRAGEVGGPWGLGFSHASLRSPNPRPLTLTLLAASLCRLPEIRAISCTTGAGCRTAQTALIHGSCCTWGNSELDGGRSSMETPTHACNLPEPQARAVAVAGRGSACSPGARSLGKIADSQPLAKA